MVLCFQSTLDYAQSSEGLQVLLQACLGSVVTAITLATACVCL